MELDLPLTFDNISSVAVDAINNFLSIVLHFFTKRSHKFAFTLDDSVEYIPTMLT